MEIVKLVEKLDKISEEITEIQLEIGSKLVKENNQELDFADNTLSNAFNNLVDTIYHLRKSIQ